MDSIPAYLHPGFWGDIAHASIDGFGGTAFWVGVPQIALINVLLSGDNAVVIAMACRGLPPRQRFWGIAIGASTAALLLIIFAGIVSQLLRLPYVKLIGGIALFYIAARLLAPEDAEQNEVEATTHLWRVVRIVVVADVIMSLDNIIAVAAIARDNLALLAVGLAISIPIILAGAALISALIDRFPILVWVGAALLGWIAGEIIATDPVVAGYLSADFGAKFAHRIAVAAACAGAVLVLVIGGYLRRR